jgi:hypothetical protein
MQQELMTGSAARLQPECWLQWSQTTRTSQSATIVTTGRMVRTKRNHHLVPVAAAITMIAQQEVFRRNLYWWVGTGVVAA